MAQVLKGIEAVRALSAQLTQQVAVLKQSGVMPCLCVIRAGNREDDTAYANGIAKRCGAIGIEVRSIVLAETVSTWQVVAAVEEANADVSVHGVLIMRPLPKQIDDRTVCAALDPAKDVDGVTGHSMAQIYAGAQDAFAPCTAEACIELLQYFGIGLEGKNVAVIGRSLVIGKPVAMMLIARHATVTVCHTRTVNIQATCKNADIIIAAAGAAKMVTADYIANGQTVIDVGINVDAQGNLCGDVDFDAVQHIAGAITPVPGGVGTVTSAILAKHVVQAAARRIDT